MLDHMVEHSGLRRSTGEQSKSVKGNRYYRILQVEKGKRDASPAIVTSAKLLTNALRHRWCPLFAEDRADGDPKFRPKGNRPEYGVRRSEVGDRTEREWERIRDRYGVRSYRSTDGAEIM